MWKNKKTWLIIGLGVLIAVAAFCLIVCIACACNGMTFGDQIVQWFTGSASTKDVLPDADDIIDGAEALFKM